MEPVFHLLIPYMLLVLAGIKVERRLLPWFIFLAFFTDLDRFFGMRHVLFSNLLFYAVAVVILIIAFRIKSGVWLNKNALLSCYFLLSHLFLDFGAPTAYFYPFDSTIYEVSVGISLRHFIPTLIWEIEEYTSVTQGVGGLIKSPGIGTILLATLVYVISKKETGRANKSSRPSV